MTAARLAGVVVARPGTVLAAALLLGLAAVSGIVNPLSGEPRLRIDPSLNEMLPDDDEGRRFYEELIRRFGSDDLVVVALQAPTLFSVEGLGALVGATERLSRLPGVHGVESLATALALRPRDGDLEISAYLDALPRDDAGAAALARRVRADSLRAGTLVSEDGSAAAILVTFVPMTEEAFLKAGLDLQLLEIAREEAARVPGMRVWMAGTPHLKAEIARILTRELAVMVPLVALLMSGISCAFFRSVRIGLAPVAGVAMGLLFTLGLMGWTGATLDIVTTLIPPLVLALGFAYAAHVAASFESEREAGAGGPPRAFRALTRVAFPVTFTALTTAAGFLSLSASPLHVIRGFGLWAAVSALVTLATTLTVVPALLALGRGRPDPRPASNPAERRLDRGLARLARFDVRHRRRVLGLGGALFVASLASAAYIEVNVPVIRNFAPDAAVRRGYEAINALFGGANQFYIMLEAEQRGAFEDPARLRVLKDLQAWLESQPEIGSTTSVVQYLEVIHAALGEETGGVPSLPDSRNLVAQLLLFGANEELDVLIDPPHRVATILVRSTATETSEFDALARRIDARLAALPPDLRGRTTGNAILLTRAAHAITRGQALSLLAASGMIGLLLVAYFRSLRLGLYALVPNLLPVALYFGAMGATGVTLNNATALMGSIVLGVAVDDTLHLLVAYRRALRAGRPRETAAAEALVDVGRAVTCTTLVVCVGLLVIGGSSLRNQAEFGLLGAATLALAWLVDVTFTPALCAAFIRGEAAQAGPEEPAARG